MDKKTYWRCKKAYELMINGCGSDCLKCERDECICDDEQLEADSDRWIAHKEIERQFYINNRERRIAAVQARYKNVPEPKGYRRLKNELLKELPHSFDYQEACNCWLTEYGCTVERLKRFIKAGLVKKKHAKPDSKLGVHNAILTKTPLYYETMVKNEKAKTATD